MATRKPFAKPVVLDGSNVSTPVRIPAGSKKVDINPLTTTISVQVAFEGELANTSPNFITLRSGQAYTIDYGDHPGGSPDGLELSFFAAAAVTVDVVAY